MAGSDEVSIPSRHFEYKNRPYRDTFATISLLLAAAALLAGGIFSFVHRDGHFFHKISDDYLSKPAHCPADAPGRLLLESDDTDGDLPFPTPYFLKWLGPWILLTLVFSTMAGLLLVHLFKTNAQRMINVAVVVMLSVWAAYAFLSVMLVGNLVVTGVCLGILAVYGLLFYLWSDKFPLMARLLAVTSTGLQQNARIALLPILSSMVLGVVSLPIVVMSGAAVMNGKVVPASDVQYLSDGTCQDTGGKTVNCCTWQPEAWVPPYVFFAMLFLSWLVFLGDQIKTFVISGTIAQWYFSPVGTSTSGNMSRSLKHALTSSFGSLSLSSAILAAVNYLRQLAENARDRQHSNLAFLLLACLADCFYSLIRFITKFATIRMAIKGDAFFSAASSITGLLRRHLLNTVAVWWLPPFFLGMYTVTLSLAWSVFVGLFSFFQSEQDVVTGATMGVIAFLICISILGFITGLMQQIVDTVYICYAMELDEQCCSKPEVHEVLNSLPKPAQRPGDVVENPDGNYAYAQQISTEQQPLLPPTAPSAPQSRV